MTYCVGMAIDRGLVFMSDTRTNAGLDNISTYRKMKIWEKPGERVLTVMSAGNLATTQAVISLLEERTKAHDEREPSLLAAPSMFQAARLVADTLREVIDAHADSGQKADSAFHATMMLGGQIKGGPPRLFLIYPEGNFIETGTIRRFSRSARSSMAAPSWCAPIGPTWISKPRSGSCW
jgi:putative proteasome-type protease